MDTINLLIISFFVLSRLLLLLFYMFHSTAIQCTTLLYHGSKFSIVCCLFSLSFFLHLASRGYPIIRFWIYAHMGNYRHLPYDFSNEMIDLRRKRNRTIASSNNITSSWGSSWCISNDITSSWGSSWCIHCWGLHRSKNII